MITAEKAKELADMFHMKENKRAEEYANNWVSHIKAKLPALVLNAANKGEYYIYPNFREDENHNRIVIESKRILMKDIITKKIKESLPYGYTLSGVSVEIATITNNGLIKTGGVQIGLFWSKIQNNDA